MLVACECVRESERACVSVRERARVSVRACACVRERADTCSRSTCSISTIIGVICRRKTNSAPSSNAQSTALLLVLSRACGMGG